jgi:catechol 2,3-dioxygenase-like lactoylglutathione lyase family enzyme
MSVGKVTRVAHTGISVSDIDRALQFFRDVLRMPVTEPVFMEDPVMASTTGVAEAAMHVAFVEMPGHKVELLQYVRPLQRTRSELRPCDVGHMHLSLQVDGIDDVVRRMREAGFIPAGPIQFLDVEGGMRLIYTYGFDGLVIELMDFDTSGTAKQTGVLTHVGE